MRTKWIIATTAAGALVLGGAAVAGPALADATGTPAAERIAGALSGLVDDGSLTQEQADEVAATLVESGVGGGRHGAHGPGIDPVAAAEALGMTVEQLRTALEAEDATLADVAEDQGVEVDTLVDALVSAAEERIAAAVEDGRLSEERADDQLADLVTRITERVNSPLPERPGGAGRGAPDGSD